MQPQPPPGGARADEAVPDEAMLGASEQAQGDRAPIVSRLAISAEARSWLLVAGLGAFPRLLLLDRVPLSEAEATSAFAVWQAVRGVLDGSLGAGGAPLMSHAMAVVFWIFGASDVAARLVPALAGSALALTPCLLRSVIGSRAALLAGLLLAISPIAVEVSRQAEPASLTAVLTAAVLFASARFFLDRPVWSPWLAAGALGAGLAHHASTLVGLVSALVVVSAVFGHWRAVRRARSALTPDLRGPLAFGAIVGVLAATAGLMDLGGIGFLVGGVWGGLTGGLAPTGPFNRNFLTLLSYGWPLLALGCAGALGSPTISPGLRGFLGGWLALLVFMAALVGSGNAALALLPLLPAAVLAAVALDRLPPWREVVHVAAPGWFAVAGSGLLAAAVLVVLALSVGASRSPSVVAIAAVAWLAAGIGLLWQRSDPADRGRSLVVLGAFCFAGLTVSGIARLSFGGSRVGTEPLPSELTAPALRDVIYEHVLLSSPEPTRVLIIDGGTPLVVRWYGRDMPQALASLGVARGAVVVHAAPGPSDPTTSGVAGRTPWKTVSVFDGEDFRPLGIARWAVSRQGLFEARPMDIIITRQS